MIRVFGSDWSWRSSISLEGCDAAATPEKSPLSAEGEYLRQGSEDTRFVDYFGTIQSIVTSSGSNDTGMFETNLRDERFLPFEGAGAESTWKLELPATFRQFDYDTVSDVILHLATPPGTVAPF